jgi:hypothetical protein
MAPFLLSRDYRIDIGGGDACNDLDAAVLRLADVVRRRNTQVVLAPSGNHETGLRHPILHQHDGGGVGPALGSRWL